MDNYSDEDDQPYKQKRSIENQHYDETLEVADGEDVASVYTPTPRHPKNHSNHQQQQSQTSQNQNRSQQLTRPTPPPTSSSVSSGGSLEDNQTRNPQRQRQPQQRLEHEAQITSTKPKKMSESQSQSPNETPVQTPKNHNPAGMKQMHGDMGDSGSEGGNESGNDSQTENYNDLQGAYDPAAFRDLPVSTEIKDIFKFIERYQPQNIELDFKLKPFIPDYIPSIGDIDAFIKVPRPDGKQDNLGFTVVDEPSSNQSDPHVLDLFFRTMSKQSVEINQPTTVKSVEGTNKKAIDSWIKNISALQKNKPVQSVNYQRAMPSIESLMQVWPPEFEDLLKEVSLPSPELNVDLNTYVDIICALLDIPVYKSRVQSIHVLFTLFSEFKNSEHFKHGAQTMNTYASQSFKGTSKKGGSGADQLVIE